MASSPGRRRPPPPTANVERATVRFSGDAGDGMYLAGTRFAAAAAAHGNELHAIPDFPAEIRAQPGTLPGVFSLQVQFGSGVRTPGDRVDTLVAMNPAALKANLADLAAGGVVIANADNFGPEELHRAGFTADPLSDGSLAAHRVLRVPITTLTREAVADLKATPKEADRCKNFFALGLVCWRYERRLDPIIAWLKGRFAATPEAFQANKHALQAGFHYGETLDIPEARARVAAGRLAPGLYRQLGGHEAMAFGLMAAAARAGRELLFAAHPTPPATELLHILTDMGAHGVRGITAESDAAAAGFALGASFGGLIGAVATSGPGLAAMSEAINLAVMAELPLVVIDVQRGGPSTGLPTKAEQADLLQALFGRSGESPLVVLAVPSPAAGFALAFEAVRLATRFMVPVLLLADVPVADGAEPWRVVAVDELPDLTVGTPAASPGVPFWPYTRNGDLARPWATPGTAGLEHRLGGQEKEPDTGSVSFEPDDHERMVGLRAEKVAGIASHLPELTVEGPADGDLLVLAWGSPSGAARAAADRLRRQGHAVAAAVLTSLNPFPANLAEVLSRYRTVAVPELNGGQLAFVLRGRFLIDVRSIAQTRGQAFAAAELDEALAALLLEE